MSYACNNTVSNHTIDPCTDGLGLGGLSPVRKTGGFLPQITRKLPAATLQKKEPFAVQESTQTALPALASRPRTYLSFNTPSFTLQTSDPKFKENARKLRTLIDKLDLPKTPFTFTLEERSSVSYLRFPEGCREHVYALTRLFPELHPYFRNDDDCACMKRFGKIATSSMGLMETATSVEIFKNHVSGVVAEADRDLRQIGRLPPVKCKLKETSRNPLRKIFSKFDGLCIGERHDWINPKKYIIDNLPDMKKLGVKTLFIETLSYDLQAQLDDYFASPSDEMPPLLQACLDAKDYGNGLSGPYTYVNLVRKAKEEGIRVVGIDTCAAYESGGDLSTTQDTINRVKTMNYVGDKIIRHEKGSGKYVVFVGGLHGGSVRMKSGVTPGLADLLRIPFMMVADAEGSPTVKMNIRGRDCGMQDLSLVAHMHIFSSSPAPNRL